MHLIGLFFPDTLFSFGVAALPPVPWLIFLQKF